MGGRVEGKGQRKERLPPSKRVLSSGSRGTTLSRCIERLESSAALLQGPLSPEQCQSLPTFPGTGSHHILPTHASSQLQLPPPYSSITSSHPLISNPYAALSLFQPHFRAGALGNPHGTAPTQALGLGRVPGPRVQARGLGQGVALSDPPLHPKEELVAPHFWGRVGVGR